MVGKMPSACFSVSHLCITLNHSITLNLKLVGKVSAQMRPPVWQTPTERERRERGRCADCGKEAALSVLLSTAASLRLRNHTER